MSRWLLPEEPAAQPARHAPQWLTFGVRRLKPFSPVNETMMSGVTIYDAPELAAVLVALGDFALSSTWTCSGVDCLGDRAEELHQLSDTGRAVPGRELIQITTGISQTIEGYFRAFLEGAAAPWMILRAVEGDFDVRTDEPAVLAAVQHRFQRVVRFSADEVV